MYLRCFCLSIGMLLGALSATAAPLPQSPKLLSSQLRIDRHEMDIDAEDWHWLRHKAELRVGVSAAESAPFSINADPQQYEGISADVTALIAQLLGMPVKVVFFANDHDAEKALQAGSVDFIAVHGNRAPGEALLLTVPYARDQLTLFKRSAEPRYSPADLAGLRVAITDEHSAELKKRFPRADFQVFADHAKAIGAVAFGQADVYLDDLYSAYYRINRSFYGYLGFERFIDLPGSGYSYALRADNIRLQRIINVAIEAIGAEQLRNVAKRWVGNSFLPREEPIDLTAEQVRWIERNGGLKEQVQHLM